ncbi:MAG: high-potential iron-sulfur protein [Dokdonella sp.]
MSEQSQNQARRRFLKLAVIGAATAPIAATLLPRLGFAADLPHLDVATDATAKALHYVEDATAAKGQAAYKPGADCSNCTFYTGKAGDEYGPCQIFPGKDVHSKGWCASHNQKPA